MEEDNRSARLWFDIFSAVVLFAVAVLGSWLPLYFSSNGQQGSPSMGLAYHLGNCLSAGVMLSAGFCHLLAESIQTLAFVGRFPMANFLSALGFLVTLAADQVVHFISHDQPLKQHASGKQSPDQASSVDVELAAPQHNLTLLRKGSSAASAGGAGGGSGGGSGSSGKWNSIRASSGTAAAGASTDVQQQHMVVGPPSANWMHRLRSASKGAAAHEQLPLLDLHRHERAQDTAGTAAFTSTHNGMHQAVNGANGHADSSADDDDDVDAPADRLIGVGPAEHHLGTNHKGCHEALLTLSGTPSRRLQAQSSWCASIDHQGNEAAAHLDVLLLAPEARSLPFATAVLLAAALCVHSVLEGMALGAQRSMRSTQDIMLAIAAHKGLAAYALGASVVETGAPIRRFWIVTLTFSLASPVAIFIGYGLSTLSSGAGGAALSALASGTFLYVAMMEVIPRELSGAAGAAGPWWLRPAKVGILSAGFAAMSVLAIWA